MTLTFFVPISSYNNWNHTVHCWPSLSQTAPRTVINSTNKLWNHWCIEIVHPTNWASHSTAHNWTELNISVTGCMSHPPPARFSSSVIIGRQKRHFSGPPEVTWPRGVAMMKMELPECLVQWRSQDLTTGQAWDNVSGHTCVCVKN